jgi:dopamine receptor D1
MHIKDPLHYNATVTTKVVVLSVVMLWILSTLISFVPLNLGWHRPAQTQNAQEYLTNSSGLNGGSKLAFLNAANTSRISPPQSANSSSSLVWDSSGTQCTLEINPIYAVTSSIISFYFPCMIMLIIYMRLYIEARRHVKCLKESIPLYYASVSTHNLSTPPQNPNNGNGPSRRGSTQDFTVSVQTTTMISEHKAAVTLGIIVSVFLICWAPFFAINIIHANCRCISTITFKALTWLGYCKLYNCSSNWRSHNLISQLNRLIN